MLRGIGLSRDDVNVWGLCYDLSKYFDEIHWPDVLRKTVFMNLLDGLVGGGNVQMAEKVHTEATECTLRGNATCVAVFAATIADQL